jgi:hypothetical protein
MTMSPSTVIPLPLPSAQRGASPTALPGVTRRPHITELDAALLFHGDLGRDGGQMFEWRGDHPLTTADGLATHAELSHASADAVPAIAERARDVANTFLSQARAFHAASRALLEDDPGHLVQARFGNGTAEVTRLLAAHASLKAPDGLSSIAAKQSLTDDIQTLATEFRRAAEASEAWGNTIHDLRDKRDGDRLAARLLTIAKDDDADTGAPGSKE